MIPPGNAAAMIDGQVARLLSHARSARQPTAPTAPSPTYRIRNEMPAAVLASAHHSGTRCPPASARTVHRAAAVADSRNGSSLTIYAASGVGWGAGATATNAIINAAVPGNHRRPHRNSSKAVPRNEHTTTTRPAVIASSPTVIPAAIASDKPAGHIEDRVGSVASV